ncbi:Maf family nucleotide pyrophosphatase [Brackiella oedipodis]|uniref:Maf family nucleotide pyrophosphatase n=1 Tax=Brackiella oedipodis TaxID=124225 RepID=UPI00048F20CD|nr:Maf family nucleotide pyrophosphatase [Brackiella oedipodis]
MSLDHANIILATTSIYKKQMFARLGLPFQSMSPNVDEIPQKGETPPACAQRLAIAKAQAIAQQHPHSIVIGADQVATLGHNIIGKAGSFAKAFQQLQALSGQSVQFHSALAVCCGAETLSYDVITECHFRDLTDAEIQHYLEVEQPYDTAGSAKAESLGISLMSSMRSDDPTAIIGLPLIELCRMLRHFGVNPTLSAQL